MKKIILSLFSITLFVSCSTTNNNITRGTNYPNVYTEKPVSILIMPPINKTVNVEAKEYFYTSMSAPLCEKGYYVISPFLAMDLLKSESAYDSEMFINNNNLSSFRSVFGADVVLFTIINEWSKSTIGSSITVNIEYILKSTTTNETLFNRTGELTLDTSINSGSSAGAFGALFDMVASAVNTTLVDKVVAARRCNQFMLGDLPEGKYAPLYGNDKDMRSGSKFFKGVVKQ